ncbi:MAG: hypothetical protein ACFFB2_04615 [Promethearchaeota archaeon]
MTVNRKRSKEKSDDIAKIPNISLDQEKEARGKRLQEASFSELVSFSRFTLIAICIFILALIISIILQYSPLENPGRYVTGIIGISILILLLSLIVDILRWRDYTEWGALGALISYGGILLIFMPLSLNMVILIEDVTFLVPFFGEFSLYLIIIILGVVIFTIGFTSRATELDHKIENLLFIMKQWITTFAFRQFFRTLGEFILTFISGFFRYIGRGIRELRTRIARLLRWTTRSFIFFLTSIKDFFYHTFPQILKRSLIGFWNNFHWLGLIAVIVYVILTDIPIPNIDPFLIKAELLIVIGFFFCLGILYPQKDRFALIAKGMRSSVLSRVISAYSMLSGTKIEMDKAIFCSRCLRGVEVREFESLMEIKGMIDPPCPFCGFNSWIGSEKVSIP